jgi:hypothetical protein
MKTTTMKKTVILSFLWLSIAASVQATPTTYEWVSGDGNPIHFTGVIVLDSNSSANGAVADVISVTINGFTSVGTFLFPLSPFTWTPQAITQMQLSGAYDAQFDQYFAIATSATTGQFGFGTLIQNYDTDGAWLAVGSSSVPDGASTVGLLLIAGATLVVARKQFHAA